MTQLPEAGPRRMLCMEPGWGRGSTAREWTLSPLGSWPTWAKNLVVSPVVS